MSNANIVQPAWANRLTIIMFILALTIPPGILIFSPDKKISLTEKRALAEKPERSLLFANLTAFRNQAEAYVNDHIGFREAAITANSAVKVVLFGVSPNIWALIGKQRWIYFWGPSSNKLSAESDFQGLYKFTLQSLDKWYVNHMALVSKLHQQGIQYEMLVAPNKQSIHPEFLPYKIQQKAGETIFDQFTGYLKDKNILGFHDLRPQLSALKKNGKVYWRTDTHWNQNGFLPVYRHIVNWGRKYYPNIPEAKSDGMFDYEEMDTVGDLVGIVGYADYFTEPAILLRQRNICASKVRTIPLTNYGFNSEQNAIEYKCGAGKKKLLFIHDSFGIPLLPLLAEHFATTISVKHGTALELQDLIFDLKPDLVVYLRVERELSTSFPHHREMVNQYLAKQYLANGEHARYFALTPESVKCFNCTLKSSPSGLEIHADTTDPYIVIDKSALKDINTAITLKIVISNRVKDKLMILYTTRNEPNFSQDKSIIVRVNEGKNTLYVRIAPDSALAMLRIDPGRVKGLYLLQEAGFLQSDLF